MSMILSMSATGLLGAKEIKEADFDDILDLGFEQFADLPEYITPAPGYASLIIRNIEEVETDKDAGLKGIRFSLEIKGYEVIGNEKFVEQGICSVDAGGQFSTLYGQGAGIQKLVADWKGIAQQLGATSIKEMLARLENATIQTEITLRAGKTKDEVTGKARLYPSLSNITLEAQAQ